MLQWNKKRVWIRLKNRAGLRMGIYRRMFCCSPIYLIVAVVRHGNSRINHWLFPIIPYCPIPIIRMCRETLCVRVRGPWWRYGVFRVALLKAVFTLHHHQLGDNCSKNPNTRIKKSKERRSPYPSQELGGKMAWIMNKTCVLVHTCVRMLAHVCALVQARACLCINLLSELWTRIIGLSWN